MMENDALLPRVHVQGEGEGMIKVYRRRWYILFIAGLFAFLQDRPSYSDGVTVRTSQGTVTVQVYRKRWYILVLASLYAFLQAEIWICWGPIANSAKAVFNWDNTQIALVANWGFITYIFSVGFLSWLMEVKGLRIAFASTAFSVALVTGLRCVSFEPTIATWLINVCAIVNGLCCPVAQGAAPVVSSIWFPPEERVTATGIMVAILGVAAGFILGPAIVQDRTDLNGTTSNASYPILPKNSTDIHDMTLTNSTTNNIALMRDEIKLYTYIQAGAATLVFLLIFIYFPSKPKNPPSLSASAPRVSFFKGLKQIIEKHDFLLITFAFTLVMSSQGCYISVLQVILDPLGLSQNEAGWIGFFGTVGSCAISFFISRVADLLVGKMKPLLIIMLTISCGLFVWLVLICTSYIPFHKVSVYLSCIGGLAISGGTYPIFYEIACEAAFPIPEALSNCFLLLIPNFTSLIFLFLFYIPNIGTVWLNWLILISSAASIPVMMLAKPKYGRLIIDGGITNNPD